MAYPTLAYRQYQTNAANASRKLALSEAFRKIQEAALTGMYNGQPTMQSKQSEVELANVAATKQNTELQNLAARGNLAEAGIVPPNASWGEKLKAWQTQGKEYLGDAYPQVTQEILQRMNNKDDLDNILGYIRSIPGARPEYFAPVLQGYQGWTDNYAPLLPAHPPTNFGPSWKDTLPSLQESIYTMLNSLPGVNGVGLAARILTSPPVVNGLSREVGSLTSFLRNIFSK